ncbi:MAG: ECF-type sigma factor [Acidobacteriota bacterium]
MTNETHHRDVDDGDSPRPRGEATILLDRASQGDEKARNELLSILHDELKRRARFILRGQRGSLQPTLLINEAYIRLFGEGPKPNFEDSGHFLSVCAQAMRHVLLDHVRRKGRKKRQAPDHDPFEDLARQYEERAIDLLSVDRALDALAREKPELVTLVEMKFFAGATMEEIAEATGRAKRSVERDWTLARSWLRRELGDDLE